jgi:flagellar basal-body rod modification protein FlgD
MTVMSVSEVYSQDTTTTTTDNSVMGKEDFLTLLVAQLQNQDPLNPADGTEFTAQLAQFSSLEELQNINDTLSTYEVYQSTLNNIQSTNFIGKTVTSTGDALTVQEDSTTLIQFNLENDADSVFLQIYDQFGAFVTDVDAGFMNAGDQQFSWDGKKADGDTVPDGTYRFTVMAMDSQGAAIDTTSYTTGVVTGVDYTSGDTNLLVNDRQIPIASVIRIDETTTADGL